MSMVRLAGRLLSIVLLAGVAFGQIYSPKVLLKDQPDASDVQSLARGILKKARAVTPQQQAEAIWRFFLPDGRFVAPGFWYHVDGWAFEEPKGEVTDPVKLLNSYGFGLCYHIASLLEAVYKAAGFEDARVWFLNGHTVTEVFYEGAYHYFDADLMGYNTKGKGKTQTVVSVQEMETEKDIMLSRLNVKGELIGGYSTPWYPADVAAGAIPAIPELFTTRDDNWLFAYQRNSQGHTMDFTLRPGERLIRYFGAEEGIFYLPYWHGSDEWKEFPQKSGRYLVKDGPQSRTDLRNWATGRIEYQPPLQDAKAFDAVENVKMAADPKGGLTRLDAQRPGSVTIDVISPYVLIDAKFSMDLTVVAENEVLLETSTDQGLTWEEGGRVKGPFEGPWKSGAKEIVATAHGRMEAVTGKYRYLLRLTMKGNSAGTSLRNLMVMSRFQYNPRTAPALVKGKNELSYQPGPQRRRWELPILLEQTERNAFRNQGLRYLTEADQGMLLPGGESGEVIYEVTAPDGSPLTGVDVGGRFLDLRDGLAPDKLTQETRQSAAAKAEPGTRAASLEWSLTAEGPYQTLWSYDPNLTWRDGKPVKQVLRWPEVDRQIRELPAGTKKIYVKYRLTGVALDDVRLAAIAAPTRKPSRLEIIHVWFEDDKERSHIERIEEPGQERNYTVQVPGKIRNYGVILSCPPL